jgi:Fis family transcriptional regulator
MVLAEVEEPLLSETFKFTSGNQSRAATVLGLSRGTVSKLARKYQLVAKRIARMAQQTDLETSTPASLRSIVRETAGHFFTQTATEIRFTYHRLINQVEKPMLQETLKFVRGNQSRAALILGVSRGTLRKLLKKHDLD